MRSERLPGDVGASWQRCRSMGTSPETAEPPYISDLDQDGALVRAAGPVLDRVESSLAGTQSAWS